MSLMDNKDIIEFEKQFKQASREAIFESKEVVRKSIQDMLIDIVEDTPVGDVEQGRRIRGLDYMPGGLKGNWQISFDSPESNEISRKDPTGTQVMSEIKSSMNAFILTDTVFFTNNASYAQEIEMEGGSRKAPAGMMRINVISFNDKIMKNIKGVK